MLSNHFLNLPAVFNSVERYNENDFEILPPESVKPIKSPDELDEYYQFERLVEYHIRNCGSYNLSPTLS